MTNDPWHFKRRTLTGRVLEVLTRGPVQALSLFAPRRAGKTEFLPGPAPARRVSRTPGWSTPQLGEETPSAARVQAALRRLERLGIADTAGGEWELADPGFRLWIRGGGGGETPASLALPPVAGDPDEF